MPRLDPNQQRAVDTRGQAILVLAGAGSGKTHTMIERAAARLDEGLSPENLLLLTFSRKACREMAVRLKARRDGFSKLPTILTYHAFGYRLIRDHPEECRRLPNPTLMDQPDQKKLFAKAFDLAGIDKEARKLASECYDLARNAGLDPEDGRHRDGIARHFLVNVDPDEQTQWLLGYSYYERLKRKANVLDFNDLQVLPAHALRDHLDMREKVAGDLHEIIIDEAQDTNLVQYRLMHLIGKAAPGTLTMVGDDDQTIYSWRGAAADNLKRFQADFNPIVVHLGTNYRSTPAIVGKARQLIEHNQNRFEKQASSSQQTGVSLPPNLLTHESGRGMAEFVADRIERRLAAGDQPEDHAILYRVNRMAKVIEPELIARGIPYRIQKGTELASRQEVQMLFAAIRLAINPQDAPAFSRLAGLARGIGEKTIERIIEDADFIGGGIDLLDAALNKQAGKRGEDDLIAIAGAVHAFRHERPETVQLVDWVKNAPPLAEHLKKLARAANDPRENINARIEHLLLFQRAIQSLSIDPDLPPADAWQHALEMTLSTPDEDDDPTGFVTLSTVHKAKGLEWNSVQVVGFSEGLMPSSLNDEDDDEEGAKDTEEERRLAYVAITRAARSLYLHHADEIRLPGQTNRYTVSRFADEMGLTPIPSGKMATSDATDMGEDDMTPDDDRPKARNPFAQAMGM